MWRTWLAAIPGALALAWVRSIVARDAELAVPTGSPIVHGSGPDPDRILVLGSPVVQGIGVTSYDLSFAGHLARKLAARTGRGADVEVHGIDRFDALIAAKAIQDENLSRFDLVLILGGVTEIVTLQPIAQYRRNLGHLLDAIARTGEPPIPVLIAGVAPFLQDMGVPRFVAAWMDKRIERQNAATRELCLATGVAEYVPFAPAHPGIRAGKDTSGAYETWAVDLVPAVARVLSLDGARVPVAQDEAARQRAVDRLGISSGVRDASVDRIVEMAKEMLGVEAASVNLIDHDRMWSTASAGIEPPVVPRERSICNTTITSPGAHVVEDVQEDPLFRDWPWTRAQHGFRFYAGYPLEAPTGERVGALCVVDPEPRSFTSSEEATLRDLALAAQAALWDRAG